MDMKQRRKGALTSRPCDLCGSLVDERDLVMSEVQGLRGQLVCSAHAWEREARVRPSFMDRGGIGQVPDLSIDPIWPGTGGDLLAQILFDTLKLDVNAIAGTSYAETAALNSDYMNGDYTVEVLAYKAVAQNAEIVNHHKASDNAGWRVFVHTTGSVRFFYRGFSVDSAADLFTWGRLHRISVTHTTAGDIAIYLDGVEIVTGTALLTPSTFDEPLGVGANPQTTSSASIEEVADVRIFSEVRSAQDIATYWNAAIFPYPSSMLYYWPINEGMGTTLTDVIGGSDMTVVDGEGWGSRSFPVPF